MAHFLLLPLGFIPMTISCIFDLVAHEYEKFFDEVYDDDLYQTQATPLTPECSSKKTPVDSGTGSMHAERLSSQYTSSSNFSSYATSHGSTEQAEKKSE